MERHADASSVVGLEVRGRCVLPWLKKLEATSPQLNLSPSHHPEPRPKRPCRVCPNWPIYVKIGSTISRLIKPRDANSERRKKTYLKRRKKATRFWRNLVFQKVRWRKRFFKEHTLNNLKNLKWLNYLVKKCYPLLIITFDLVSSFYSDMPLVDESEEDRKLATLIKYKSVESYDERQARKRKAIEEASVGRVSQLRP